MCSPVLLSLSATRLDRWISSVSKSLIDPWKTPFRGRARSRKQSIHFGCKTHLPVPRERETELIHLSRRVADKDNGKQESTTEQQKSLCLNLWKTARQRKILFYTGLCSQDPTRPGQNKQKRLSFRWRRGQPAGVSAHRGRTVFLSDSPRKREEPNPHTGQKNLCRGSVTWIPPALMSTGEDPGAGANRL